MGNEDNKDIIVCTYLQNQGTYSVNFVDCRDKYDVFELMCVIYRNNCKGNNILNGYVILDQFMFEVKSCMFVDGRLLFNGKTRTIEPPNYFNDAIELYEKYTRRINKRYGKL